MNILITGANGFIGNNLVNSLKQNINFKIFEGNRKTINLCSKDNIKDFVEKNNITTVIHCAIEGGHRLQPDSPDIVYKNITMFENLYSQNFKLFINIGSGAEYDRSKNISNVNHTSLFTSIPSDYYGFSKNIISKLIKDRSNIISLYLFNCFYYNELSTRFIKNSITNYINNKSIIIHQDKYMDFFYMEDMIKVITHILTNYSNNNFIKYINLAYSEKYKLSDIANIINNLEEKKVNIIIENSELGLSYTGDSESLNILDLDLKKIEIGIKECYNKLK